MFPTCFIYAFKYFGTSAHVSFCCGTPRDFWYGQFHAMPLVFQCGGSMTIRGTYCRVWLVINGCVLVRDCLFLSIKAKITQGLPAHLLKSCRRHSHTSLYTCFEYCFLFCRLKLVCFLAFGGGSHLWSPLSRSGAATATPGTAGTWGRDATAGDLSRIWWVLLAAIVEVH